MLTLSGRSTPFDNIRSSQTSNNYGTSNEFCSRELSTDLTDSINDLFRQDASKLFDSKFTRSVDNQFYEYNRSINVSENNNDSDIIAQMEFDLVFQPSLTMGDKSSVLTTLDNIIDAIKIKSFEEQRHLVKYLESFLGLLARESNIEELQYYQNYITTKAIHLVQDNNNNNSKKVINAKIGGILTIQGLIRFYSQTEDIPNHIHKLVEALWGLLSSPNIEVIKLVTQILGNLSKSDGPLMSDYVEEEIKIGLDWLVSSTEKKSVSKNAKRKHAAILIIYTIAINSPYSIFPHINIILDNIWKALKDPNKDLRTDSAITLKQCLLIIQRRDKTLFNQQVASFQLACSNEINTNNMDTIHSCLLVYKVLLSLNEHEILDKTFDEIFALSWNFKDNKIDYIRLESYQLFTMLSSFNSDRFTKNYLDQIMMMYLNKLQMVNKSTSHIDKIDHPILIRSVGEMALHLGKEINPYLPSIVEILNHDLNTKYKNRIVFEKEIFYCIARLVEGTRTEMIIFLRDCLLESMLKCPLTDYMQFTLQIITSQIPELETVISDKLLSLISLTLSGCPFKLPGSPGERRQFSMQRAREWRNENEFRQKNITNNNDNDKNMIVQALRMLLTLDYKYQMTDFVRETIISYIEHENTQVRKLAAITSCHLLIKDNIGRNTSLNSLNILSEILSKLLTVAITDINPEVRLKILENLDHSFDPHLSQPDNLRLLFMLLEDEVYIIRVTALKVIGRLTAVNPAYIVPMLRKTLLELLTELKYLKLPNQNEECLTMLCTLISSTNDLTKPYIEPILDVLLEKLHNSSSSVISSTLRTIGELSIVGGENMNDYLDKLMPPIIEAFKDQSNTYKRSVALRTLRQLSSASGYVINPLLDYTELLSILTNILKSDSSQHIKQETVSLLGTLGALDPYKYREIEEKSEGSKNLQQTSIPIDISLLIQNISSSNEEYYPTIVVNTLLKILKDNSLSVHHPAVIQAIVNLFQILKLKCVPFLGQIIPAMINLMGSCPYALVDYYLQQLAILILIVKSHIRPYADKIFNCIESRFSDNKLQLTVISVIKSLGSSLKNEFKRFVPSVLTHFMNSINKDKSKDKAVTNAIFDCIIILGENLDEYLYLIIPSIIKIAELSHGFIKKSAIVTLGKLTNINNINSMSARIVHTCCRLLYSTDLEIIRLTMNLLCLLLLRLKSDFVVFIPSINKLLITKDIQHAVYDQLVNKLLNNEILPSAHILGLVSGENKAEEKSKNQQLEKLTVDQPLLKSLWNCSQQRTKEDWQEWLKRLSIQLLKESPSYSLRVCSPLASVYLPLAKELFNASFASVWPELYTQYQEDFVQSLCLALSSPQNPPEIHQTLLNLIEFMEHDDKPLPIPSQTLGEYAEKCHAYAKALHFKEAKFLQEPIDNTTVESLISINNQIYQNDAAVGILKFAQQHHNLQLQETWYEKLQRWEDAMDAYSKRIEEGDTSPTVTLGYMKSLYSLSDWDSLAKFSSERWDSASISLKKRMAPLAANGAWSLAQWDKLEQYISVMKDKTPDKEFFSAILCIHNGDYDFASEHIYNARDLLVTEISALVNESYNRAYNVIVRTQLITELEEVIAYKKLPSNSERRVVYHNTWNKRLLGCQKSVDVWQRTLKVRSLVISPKQDMHIWIKFANLCRKSGKLNLAEAALSRLLEGTSDISPSLPAKAPPPVVYSQLKYLWAVGSRQEALKYLIGFTSRMAHDLGLDPSNMIAQNVSQNHSLSTANIEEYTKLLARCFLKQGEWRIALQPNWRDENPDAILGSYLLATHFDSNWYKAWHNWALVNFEVISAVTSGRRVNTVTSDEKPKITKENEESVNESVNNLKIDGKEYSMELIQRHVIPAIKGFFHSIALSKTSALQDILRLLTLWFTFGGTPEACKAIYAGFNLITIDTWLEVLPQLISRIHQPDEAVSRSLLSLLSDLGKAHPQVMVNPLIVAIKSESISRQKAAFSIIEKMKMHSTKLVEQAELVSNELIRVAVLWDELWYEGLEDASRQFFGEHNIDKMFATLEPLHQLLKKEPETMRELSFQNSFGRDLTDAYEWVLNFKRTKDTNNLNQAWDIYYNVFRRISRQLPQLQTLDLRYVSPKLLEARDLEMAVPGSYSVGKPVIRISYFDPIFSVISSKQRPRKFTIRGSDGKDYQYVLKGHEDIRQDSLVMQLFGLVNTLLEHDPECFKRHLDIQKYPAIPLSPKSGLLGWVPNSDTFHVLIRDHREANKVPLNIEHWVMLQMAPDYDNLTLLQKIEVFQYAMDNTKGQDLAQVLWLKSRSSEIWLDRRTVYSRSLAVMSMVGYILGLGDRHPSNLMLDRVTGKVIHIDFGDCFEAAILREKFPEKVPFRLTRMLINALEVGGIEGNFRITCENVMRVLRNNKESLMAILEAFAFDPLIHWGFDFPTDKIMKETGITLPMVNPNELLRKGAITVAEAHRMEEEQELELRNARALLVLKRITDKLTGNDIRRYENLDIPEQVDKLIKQATSIENLCQHYVGWCPFW